MIDVADLPAPVRVTVAAFPDGLDRLVGAALLRACAARSFQAIGFIWPTEQYHQVQEQLALCAGYLTAATRLEEQDTPT